jgi:hypothetical protein
VNWAVGCVVLCCAVEVRMNGTHLANAPRRNGPAPSPSSSAREAGISKAIYFSTNGL